jgi:hypothetical protein
MLPSIDSAGLVMIEEGDDKRSGEYIRIPNSQKAPVNQKPVFFIPAWHSGE